MNRRFILALCGLLSGTAVIAQPATPEHAVLDRSVTAIQSDEALFAALPSRMTALHVAGLSVALIENDKIAWERAFGVSGPDGNAVTTDTIFQAGSLSKPVAAAAALSVSLAGKMPLDVPVNSILKNWKLPDSDAGPANAVTPRRLLGHSGGVGIHGFRGFGAPEPLPAITDELDGLGGGEALRIVDKPGQSLVYSGGAYLLVQKLLEDRTGKPFAAIAQSAVLSATGMKHSFYAADLPRDAAARAAAGYSRTGAPIPGGWRRFPELAAAGLWATPGDLARFMLWLNHGYRGLGVGRQRAIAGLMLTRQRDTAGRLLATPSGAGAGLGLVVEGEGKALRYSHAGANPGQKAFMISFPATGQGVVVMSNSDLSPPLIQQVVRDLARIHHWPDPLEPKRPLQPATAPSR